MRVQKATAPKVKPVGRAPGREPVAVAAMKPALEACFAEVVTLITQARLRAYKIANTTMLDLYWDLGAYLHHKIEADGWAKGTVVKLAAYIAQREPGAHGYSPQNLWRMRQLYQTYRGDEKLSPLVRVLPWTHNLIILAQAKRPEEREFYLSMAAQQGWGKRELERQFRLAAFEKAVLTPPSLSPAVREIHGAEAIATFKDVYAVEFLHLPRGHTEADLHRGLLPSYATF